MLDCLLWATRILPPSHSDHLTTPDGATIDYLVVGSGPIRLLTIPGAGDGLATVGQEEMAALIPDSRLVLYPGYGHGTFEEQPDYERQVRAFAEAVWVAQAAEAGHRR